MGNYKKKRDAAARRSREEAAEGKDIGEIPGVKNPRRRKKCAESLELYLRTYYPETFPWPWSDDHLEQIGEMERVIRRGGLKALAAPRGDGKSTKIIRACNWALSYGYRHFIVLIASETDKGEEDLLGPMKMEWETNDLLLEDFPEIAYPIRALEGHNNRCKGQTINGHRTHIYWKDKAIVFPTVKNSLASGATVRVRGILSGVRGMTYTTAKGKTIRPDLVLVDDPQTDISAWSDPQCAKREKILGGAVLGLAGPGKRVNGFAAVTVIREGDLAHRLLNRKLHPRWQGGTYKLVYEWPKNEELLKQYLELRSIDIQNGDDQAKKATAFWKKHQKKLELGARIGWAHRKEPHEVSAIQHAVNLRQDNPDSFDAEYMNSPQSRRDETSGLKLPTSDDIVLQVSGYERTIVPESCQFLTCGIDVQQEILFWVVSAVDEDFSGWVVDYGSWPEQPLQHFGLSDVQHTIQKKTGVMQVGAAIRAAVMALTTELSQRRFERVDGAQLGIERFHIDAGFETKAIYAIARQSGVVMWPVHGKGVTAKQVPWERLKRRRGERKGFGWRAPPVVKTDAPRHLLIDVNAWKTELLPRWLLPSIHQVRGVSSKRRRQSIACTATIWLPSLRRRPRATNASSTSSASVPTSKTTIWMQRSTRRWRRTLLERDCPTISNQRVACGRLARTLDAKVPCVRSKLPLHQKPLLQQRKTHANRSRIGRPQPKRGAVHVMRPRSNL